MKTDNYLTLCLEQATKSPLHYRHGCIIVRGGKVIGQGYNDYRPGFNGGALKTGRIAAGSFDGPAILDLKEKHKQKKKQKLEQQQQRTSSHTSGTTGSSVSSVTTTSTFTPFEALSGGGHLANTPLSMHSEMSAIHSALAATTALGSSAFSCQQPCFKLPGLSKRKGERLRNGTQRDAIAEYVERICGTQAGTGKLQVQECGFERGACGSGGEVRQRQQQRRVRVWVQGKAGGEGRGVSGGERWRETWEEEQREEEPWWPSEGGSSSASSAAAPF